MSHETQLFVQVNSHTWLKADREGVVLVVTRLSVNILKTTINEQVDLVKLSEGVTSVGIDAKNICLNAGLNTANLYRVLSVTISKGNTYRPVLVEVLTNLRNQFDNCIGVVTL